MKEDVEAQQKLSGIKPWADYSRLPPRLEMMFPALAETQPDDVQGLVARFDAVRHALAGRKLGAITDLGGNSGYFSLSLIDGGMASGSIVYDIDDGALAAGRAMADLLGIGDRIRYVKGAIDLAAARELAPTDTFMCLNFLHNGGRHFDVDIVREEGWANYIRAWLETLRRKAQLAIISLGFTPEEPVNWDEPLDSRARRFTGFAQDAGWSVRYYANVLEIQKFGAEAAAGRYTAPATGTLDRSLKSAITIGNAWPLRPIKAAAKNLLRRTGTLSRVQNITGSQKFYHIYILE